MDSHEMQPTEFKDHSEKQSETDEIVELTNIFTEKSKSGGLDVFEKVGKFGAELQKEFSREELEGYTLWHLIASSGKREGRTHTLDLPDKRIEHFIREL